MPFTQTAGESLPIVRLSITAESLHLACKTKQKRLQGACAQILKGTQIGDNTPCRQRDGNDTQPTFTHTVLVQSKRNERGTLGDVCLHLPSSGSVITLVRASMCTCVFTGSCLCPQPCCCHWRGSIIQLCSWHGTLSYTRTEQKT